MHVLNLNPRHLETGSWSVLASQVSLLGELQLMRDLISMEKMGGT